jgi:hypothetical protein
MCATVGLVLIAVGVIIGVPAVSVEGAYFDQLSGPPKYAGVFSASAPGLVDPRDGNLWLGAGIVLVVVAVSVAICSRLMLVRRASPPD